MTKQAPPPSTGPHDAGAGEHDRHTVEAVGAGAGIAAALLLLRVLAVSHWDWTVAGHVLDTFDFGSAVSVAVGTLFASPALAAVVAAALMPFAVLGIRIAVLQRTSMVAPLAVTVLCASILVSLAVSTDAWWGALAAGALTAAALIVMGLRAAGRLRAGMRWLVRRLGMAVLVGLLVLVIGVQDPWVSAERITMTDGTVRTLYVLTESPNGIHVLVPGGDVEILPPADVASRVYP